MCNLFLIRKGRHGGGLGPNWDIESQVECRLKEPTPICGPTDWMRHLFYFNSNIIPLIFLHEISFLYTF